MGLCEVPMPRTISAILASARPGGLMLAHPPSANLTTAPPRSLCRIQLLDTGPPQKTARTGAPIGYGSTTQGSTARPERGGAPLRTLRPAAALGAAQIGFLDQGILEQLGGGAAQHDLAHL